MSIDGSGAHRIYQPEPSISDAEAQAALERDPRDWTGAGHLPPAWILALADIDPLAPHGVDISGTWVTFTVAANTDDPSVMCSALRQLTRVVADTTAAHPDIAAIDRRLPEQIGSARWHTGHGDVTVIRPDRPRRRRRPRRFLAGGAAITTLWALAHGKLPGCLSPISAAAGVVTVATVGAVAVPAAVPAAPRPGSSREVFVPAREQPAKPSVASRIPMSAPAHPKAPHARTDPHPRAAQAVPAPAPAKTHSKASAMPSPTGLVPSLPNPTRTRRRCNAINIVILHVEPCRR